MCNVLGVEGSGFSLLPDREAYSISRESWTGKFAFS